MNRHYLRERDFPVVDDEAEQEPVPTLDASQARLAMTIMLIVIMVPLVIWFALACWYGLFLFVKFLYDLAASSITTFIHLR